MLNPRTRAVAGAAGPWLESGRGLGRVLVFRNLKVTAEKGPGLRRVGGFEQAVRRRRAKALQRLADMLNRLSPEERRQMRFGRTRETGSRR